MLGEVKNSLLSCSGRGVCNKLYLLMSGEVKNSLSDGKIYLLMLREVKNSFLSCPGRGACSRLYLLMSGDVKITVRLSDISSKNYNLITFDGLKMPLLN